MKIKFLMAGLFSVVSVSAVFAQKGILNDAQDAFAKYEALRGQPVLGRPSLDNAKMLIDKAAANDKTATLPQTYAVKGGVYSELCLLDSIPSTSTPLFITADEALKKAKETDAKGEYAKIIEVGYHNLAQYQLNKGVKDYQNKNYNAAYEAFNYYRMVIPTDTNAIYYTGLAAVNSKKYPEAIANYNTLLTTKYSQKARVYGDLTELYLDNHDTTGAMKIITEGVEKYPDNSSLSNREIQIYIQQGRIKEVSDKLDKAIANDPKNKNLYYYSGYIYTKTDNNEKAAQQFNKALEIDPAYYDANLNMGFIYLNQGVVLFNKANKMPATKANQKQYEDMTAEATALFTKAQPYLMKAVEENPKSIDALSALKNIYLGKKDNANANTIQKQIDALKQ